MAFIIQAVQELWRKLFRKNDSSAESYGLSKTFEDFDIFARYVDSETKEKAQGISALSSRGRAHGNNDFVSFEIPVAIGRFSQLISLQVTACGLNSLPWSMVYLKQLRDLDLSDNRLQYLPSSIGALSNLQTLKVENNLLFVLPTSFLNLRMLKELSLNGNTRLESPDYTVCMQGLQAIRSDISKRKTHVNMWAGCRVAGEFHPKINEVPSLFSIAASAITSSKMDFLSASYVPPRLKTYLVESKRFEIQLAKCRSCRGYFSNSVMLEAHVCRALKS